MTMPIAELQLMTRLAELKAEKRSLRRELGDVCAQLCPNCRMEREKKAAAQTSRNGATKSSRSSPGRILPGTSNLSSANKATLGILGRERFTSVS